MDKRLSLIFVSVLLVITSHAQKQTMAKTVFAEAGGAGLLSINYDMRVTQSQSGIGFRAGFGGWSLKNSKLTFIPLGINWLAGKNGTDYFEVGAGGTIVNNSSAKSDDTSPFKKSFGWLNLGYRKQPSNGGLMWRATLVPVFGSGYFWPYWVGASIGYAF